MTVIHTLSTDLVRRGVTPRVYAMQFDGNTRVVEFTLTALGEPWQPPADVAFALSYRKADGTRGLYNQLADGVSAIAVSENKVSVTLAPQVLTAPGIVEAALVLQQGDQRVAAFPFEIHVTEDPGAGTEESDDYFNCSGGGGAFYVTATAVLNNEGGTRVTADKTMAQIQSANNAKQSVYLRFPLGALNDNLEATDYLLIPMVFCESYAIGFSLYAGSEAIGNPGNAVFEALMEDDEYFYVTRKEVSGGSANAVLYTGQILSEEEKTQARENIGAVSETEVTAMINNALENIETLPSAEGVGF